MGSVPQFLVALVLMAFCGACAPNTGPPPSTRPSDDPAQALRDAQAALERAGGYALTVEQENVVLPQWGGSDGGSVRVSQDAQTATAELWRTGEGGPYSIIHADGQTYFRRSTCQTWARIPGGGKDVLAPFLFARTKALANAVVVSASGTNIEAEVEGIGRALVALHPTTALPVSIIAEGTANRGRLKWTFSRWGEALTAKAPDTGGIDRGPGGNPC